MSDLADLLSGLFSHPRDPSGWPQLCAGGEATYRLLEPSFGKLPRRKLVVALLAELDFPDRIERLAALYREGGPLVSTLACLVLSRIGGAEAASVLRSPPGCGVNPAWVEALDLLDEPWTWDVLDRTINPIWEALEERGISALALHLQLAGNLGMLVRAAVLGARRGDPRSCGRCYAAAIYGIGADPARAAQVRSAALLDLETLAAPGLGAALQRSVRVGGEGASLALHVLGRLGRSESVPFLLEARRRRGTREAAVDSLGALLGTDTAALPDARIEQEARARLAPGICYGGGAPEEMPRRIAALRHRWPGARQGFVLAARTPWLNPGPGSLELTPRESTLLDAFWPARASEFPPGALHRWGRSYAPTVVDGPLPDLPDLRKP